MLDHALFVTTDIFEVTTPKEHFINERCFGEDFAEWRRSRLNARQITCDEPVQEDWGWALLVTLDGRTFTIAIGVMDDSIGKVPAEWRVSLAYERFLNRIPNWFRAVPRDQFQHMFGQLKAILEAEPRFAVSETERV
jgi:hypothetical protein